MAADRVGVYFLGDDGAYKQVVPLLDSIRKAAPDVTIHCIAFTDRLNRLSALESKYKFTIINDPSLAELDDIGRRLFGHMVQPMNMRLLGSIRRFYAFWGPLDRFFYSDADVVMMDGFAEFFSQVTAADGPAFGYAHDDVEQVYRPGALREEMVRDYHTPAFNAGLFASKRGLLTLEQIRELAIRAEPIAKGFVHTLEQPLFNWMLDVNRVEMKRFATPGLECAWSGDARPMKMKKLPNGGLEVRWPDGSRIPVIHFAGFGIRPRTPNYNIYRYFARRSLPRAERMQMYRREFLHTPGIIDAGRIARRIVWRMRGRKV